MVVVLVWCLHVVSFARGACCVVQGRQLLDNLPPNAIVLLNGDLNNNLPKYAQQCEGLRPDVSLVSMQLMSWEWFVPMQRGNYPNVKFPNEVYHPHKVQPVSDRSIVVV